MIVGICFYDVFFFFTSFRDAQMGKTIHDKMTTCLILAILIFKF